MERATERTRAARLLLCRPAEPSQLRGIRRAVDAWADTHRLPDAAVADLQLAVGEAVANGVEHAYREDPPGTVEVEMSVRVAESRVVAVVVAVVDHGRWRPAPLDAGHRGRGLAMIGRLAKRLRVVAGRNGTRVGFEIPVST